FFCQAEDGIRAFHVTGVQTCALPIWTSTRRAACLCSVCSMDKDPGSKGAANKSDVTALLGMIAAAVEDLDGPANWAKASTIANLRQQLRDIAVGIALRDGESEEEAAARIEAALERGDAL